MKIERRITPFLWYDTQAEEAAQFYIDVFGDGRILNVHRYCEGGRGPTGSVMVVAFEIGGQRFTALNGGPMFKFNESVSFVVSCRDQVEIDHFWERLSEGGAKSQCGWLKDRYGLSWQVVPERLPELMGPDAATSGRVMGALMTMQKIDIAALEAARAG